jgi:hypothetical protein
MSHLCIKVSCPNRVAVGSENDDDVINIICPKCERLLYVSYIKTKKRKRFLNLAFTLIIIISLTIPVFIYKNEISSFVGQFEFVTNDQQTQAIKSLIRAEDNRDYNKIKIYFSDTIVRYWEKKYLDKQELKIQYLKSWRKTFYSKNEIQKIVKDNSNTFTLFTKFTYFDTKESVEKIKYSMVRYIFDDYGKIIEVYGLGVASGKGL